MKNKKLINKLKSNAELAMAAYGYFHLIGKKIENDREKYGDKANKPITLHDILDITYKDYVTTDHTMLINPEYLNGDFSPIQAKRFFERYDLLIHQPNTESGFSATLFGEKRKQIDSKTKKVSYTSNHGYVNYIFAIRGTELKINQAWQDAIIADGSLVLNSIPKNQYDDMLLFYHQCIGKIPFYVEIDSKPKDKDDSVLCNTLGICNHSIKYELWQKLYKRSKDSAYKPYINQSLLKDFTKPPYLKSNFTPPIDSKTKLTITGHSLGGALAQLFALSICDDKNRNNIKALYTYNAPGARMITPPYDYIVKLFVFHSKAQQERFIREEVENIANRARVLAKNNISLEGKIQQTLQYILEKQESQYYGITLNISNTTTTMVLNITATPLLADIAPYYKQLAYNYTQHFKEETPQNFRLKGDERYIYKLSIQDSIYHCESSNNEYKNEWYLGSPISKLGIKLGLHQDNQYSDTAILHTITTAKGITGDHSIVPLAQTLYFYSYLLELDSNLAFFESNLDKTIQSLNSVVTSIVKILYHTDSYNKKRDEAIRTANDNSFDLDPPPNHIYATIDKTLFEATLKTKQDKFSIDEKTLSNMIDGILYLQDNNIFLKLLSKDNIQQADKNTNLAILLAIHENLFFISVDTANNKEAILIKDKESIVQLLKHNATRTQIFCYNLEHIDDRVIKGYANEALKYYPQFKES